MTFEALRKLAEKGFPQKAIFTISLKAGKNIFYLASLCIGLNDWIMLFPETISKTIRFYDKKVSQTKKFIGGTLHHITIVKNLKWHFTTQEGKHIYRKLKLHKITDNVYYWFSLSVKSLEEFQKFSLKDDKNFTLKGIFSGIPESNSIRRFEALKMVINNSEDILLTPKMFENKSDFQNGFIHFDFFIELENSNYNDEKYPLNLPSELINLESNKCESSIHKINIVNGKNLIIRLSWIRGEMKHQILYNWYLK